MKKYLVQFGVMLAVIFFIVAASYPVAAQQNTTTSESVSGIVERIAPRGIGEGKVITLADRLDPRKPEGEAIGNIWRILLNITNGAVILVFLIMGFATIFNVQVDTYGVKKALPNVIIALILANFSLFITRMVVDITNIGVVAIVNNFPGGHKGLVDSITEGFITGGLGTLASLIDRFKDLGGDSTNSLGLINDVLRNLKWVGVAFLAYTGSGFLLLGIVVLAALAMILPSIFVLILAILFYVRTYVILALAAVSPLAFIAFALPAGQVLFRQWTTQLFRWAFMGPIAFFMIWLAVVFGKAFGGGFDFGIYLLYLTMLYLAISLPFKMGGVITANVSKYLGKPLRQAGGFGARWYGRTGDVLSGAVSSKLGGKPITIGGLYRGWAANSDRYYQRHVAKTSGVGEDIREAATTAATSFVPWRWGEIPSRLVRAGNILKSGDRYQQALQKEIATNAQQLSSLPEDAVARGLQQAIDGGKEHDRIAEYLLAKAMQGQDVSQDFEQIERAGLHTRPEIAAALVNAQKAAAENGLVVANPNHGEERADKALEVFNKANRGKPTSVQAGILERLAKRLRDDQGKPKFDEASLAAARYIEDNQTEDQEKTGKFTEALAPYRAQIELEAPSPEEVQTALTDLQGQGNRVNLRPLLSLDPNSKLTKEQLAQLLALDELAKINIDPRIRNQNNQARNKFGAQLDMVKNAPQVNSLIRRSQMGGWPGINTPPKPEELSMASQLAANQQVMVGLKLNRTQVIEDAKREIAALQPQLQAIIGNTTEFSMPTVIRLHAQFKQAAGYQGLAAKEQSEATRQLYRMFRAHESYARPHALLNKYRDKDKQIRNVLDQLK